MPPTSPPAVAARTANAKQVGSKRAQTKQTTSNTAKDTGTGMQAKLGKKRKTIPVEMPKYDAWDGDVLFNAYKKKLADAVDAIDVGEEISAQLKDADASVIVRLVNIVASSYFLCKTADPHAFDEQFLRRQAGHQIKIALRNANPDLYRYVVSIQDKDADKIFNAINDKLAEKVLLQIMSEGVGSVESAGERSRD